MYKIYGAFVVPICKFIKIETTSIAESRNYKYQSKHFCIQRVIKFLPIIKELFKKQYNRRMLVRLIGVKYSHLVEGGFQMDLFDDNAAILNVYKPWTK